MGIKFRIYPLLYNEGTVILILQFYHFVNQNNRIPSSTVTLIMLNEIGMIL